MASDSREIQIMRAICWERAKGELGALVETYWEEGNCKKMQEEINKFIDIVENDELFT
jgi:hypothetical protein